MASMLALFSASILLLAAGGASGGYWGAVREFWDHYLNYPGFELWKFFNLAVFVGFLIFVSKRLKLSDAFKARREEIRAEIIKAEQEKKAALEQLTTIEAKLVGIDAEKEAIMNSARAEIEAEKARLVEQGRAEAAKLKAQADGEIVRLGQVAKLQLRRFAVDESLRMAEEKLTAKVDENTDAKLIRSGISAIGGLS